MKTALSGKRITVSVVDRHPVVRAGVRACLANRRHLVVVGEARDGSEALRAVKRLGPDLVVIDLDVARDDRFAVSEGLISVAE